MRRSIVLFFTLLTSFNLLGQSSAHFLTKEQVKADVDYLVSAVDETPVNPYTRITKSHFLTEIDKAERKLLNIQQIKVTDLYTCLQPVIVKLEDGHTELYVNSTLEETNYLVFPFNFSVSAKGLLVTSINAGYQNQVSSDVIGKKLLNINGHSSQQILNIIDQYNSGETKNSRLALSGYIFNTIFNLFLSKEKELNIQFSDKVNLRLNLLRKSEIKNTATTDRSNPNYAYELKEEQKTAILTFNDFSDLNRFKSFLTEMFASMKQKNIKNLIIDIRNNGGGNSDLGDELLKYIARFRLPNTKKPY